MIPLLAQAMPPDLSAHPVQWGHVGYLVGLAISLVGMVVSLIVGIGAMRKSSNAKDDADHAQKVVTKIATEQSAACRADHDGIRTILLAQGVTAAENTKNLGAMVESFAELATSIKIRDVQKDAEIQIREKDNELHRQEMRRLLESIETKLTKE